MAVTTIARAATLEIKKQSALLATEVHPKMFFGPGMTGKGEKTQMPVMLLTELEADKGGVIEYQLRANLKMAPVYGDNVLAGKEGELTFWTDSLYIEQVRQGANAGGKMTRKRTVHDLRSIAREALSTYFAELFDEYCFTYAAGVRGSNSDYILESDFTGFGGNTISAPDSAHRKVVGETYGSGTLASLDSGNILTVTEMNALKTINDVLGGGVVGSCPIQPIKIEGGEYLCYVMHPYAENDLRNDATDGNWFSIQKALATALGNKSPLIHGGVGMINNIVLKTSKKIPTFANATAYNSETAGAAGCRNLLLGRQALAVAFGMKGTGLRFDWTEETEDRGNKLVIDAGTIVGVCKTTFNGYDFGVIAHDCAAAAV